MPKLDRQMFEELSRETAFQVDILEKVYRLTEILTEISNTELSDFLVLKGGTAINFVYLDLPRLSVDIDMDYIGSTEKEKMLKDRENIYDLSKKVFKTIGYETEHTRSYALDKYNLYYQNSVGNRDRIKFEVNYLKRATVLKPIDMEFNHIFELKRFKIPTLQIEDLFGRKMNALVRRATPKDLFDIFKLLKSDLEYNNDLLKKCFIFTMCLDEDPRNIEYEIFKEISERDVWTSLTPMLRKGEKFSLQKMREEVEPFLKKMIDFSENEYDFIKALFDEEIYDIDILFEEGGYNEKLVEHPGVEWRLKNL
ncbi:MAG: nucleotidyl transferase AbiEii/AbiGii toxin family protein [Thermoplasmatota archaeon]